MRLLYEILGPQILIEFESKNQFETLLINCYSFAKQAEGDKHANCST